MPKPRSMNNDLTGQTFFRWTVLSRNYDTNSKGSAWNCICDPQHGGCGTERVVLLTNLRSGMSRSCGCLRDERVSDTQKTHGMSRTPIYIVWVNMKGRCLSPKDAKYKDYGGRGITICERWAESFENFYADVGDPPTPEHTIDRIDVNGNYTPENVKWSTKTEQAQNRRNNRPYTINGVTKLMCGWAKEYGINPGTLSHRIDVKGMTIEEALSAKVTRQDVTVEYLGRTWTVAQLAAEYKVKHNMIAQRLKRGWTVEQALTTPVRVTQRGS